MVDVKLLGTGGMMPLLNRYLTSLLIKFNGMNILVDCGEATQLALRNANESGKDIDIICITHFHADHISGLGGLLLLMGNQGKTTPLTIIGPRGIERVVRQLRVVAPVLPFKINCVDLSIAESNEFKLNELTVHTFNEFTIKAFKVEHKVDCYGYTFSVNRLPKFNVEKAKKLPIEKSDWGKLQHGISVIGKDGKSYTPDMVLGESRKGLKITYCTDTRPCKSIVDNAINSDLFICEGMYGDEDKRKDALEKKHMLFSEAAQIAKKANVNEMWLTHFSPSIINPREHLNNATNIFKNTKIPKDGWCKELNFED